MPVTLFKVALARQFARPGSTTATISHIEIVFTIEFTRAADRQLADLRAYERAIVVDAIEKQLSHEPLVETRRRKKLEPNTVAGWELRVGDVRILYDVEEDTQRVLVLAIGSKRGDQLIIDGEDVPL